MQRSRLWSVSLIPLALVALVAAISSCRTPLDGPPSQTTKQTFTGVASAGPISAGTVSAYALNADGTRGDLLETTMTDAEGAFSLSIPTQSGPIELSVTGGSFAEEASGGTVAVGNHELRLWLPSGVTGGNVGITPLTEIAAARAETLQSAGGTLVPHIETANAAMATASGLTDITIPPADPTKTLADPTGQAAKYALVLAGISEYAKDNSLTDSFTMVETLSDDFHTDGIFDGKDGAATVDFSGTSTPIPSALWQTDLATSMTTFANSTAGSSVGFTASAAPTLNPNPGGGTVNCTSGLTSCSGQCFDLTSNVSNCGACGAACSLTNAVPSCSAGQCGIASCQTGFGDCDSSATDGCETNLTNSVSNCGTCGHVCSVQSNSVPSCVSGSCQVSCNPGYADCDHNPNNGCEMSVSNNNSNCGACGNVCPGGQTCSAGACH